TASRPRSARSLRSTSVLACRTGRTKRHPGTHYPLSKPPTMVGLQSTTSITALSSLVRLAILILTVVSFIRRRARTLPRHRPEPHRYLPAPCRSTSVHGYRLPPLA